MTRLVLVAVALLAVGGFADPVKHATHTKVVDKVFLKRQMDIMGLYYHVHEPVFEPELKTISETWSLEKNIEKYSNVTAVKIYAELMSYAMTLPRRVAFAVLQKEHLFEAVTLFNVLFSAKDYDTFYKTAVYLRDRVNEGLYIYSLSIAILYYPETKGIIIPPIYEVFPSFFHNGQVMHTAQRINTHGKRWIEHYPGTYVWDENVVIKWNETIWPYWNREFALAYFTHDYHLNALYYNLHLANPFWLSTSTGPFAKSNHGEFFWFSHKQLLAHYYMERLSNGLGEIPELDFDVVQQGYSDGLLYHNGVPFPTRPNHFSLEQPLFEDTITKIKDIEGRIRNAIDLGYVINGAGEHVSIRTPESIDVLGKLIEGSVDSPNWPYYQEFIGIWKYLLGNAIVPAHQYKNGHIPLVVPSTLENYQTALRDPAFYMIWKRVLKLFTQWQTYLPEYKYEELVLPSVTIEKVEVDKLVTYFENNFLNVSNHLHLSEHEVQIMTDDVSVLVQHPVLTHKPYKVRLNVKSDVAKTVFVTFFLAPKYDSKGVEIPIHLNTENFMVIDQFVHELPAGESVIKRESHENKFVIDRWTPAVQIYEKALNAYNGHGEFVLDEEEHFEGYPRRLVLPKGRVGGMPFVFMAYITEYTAPKQYNDVTGNIWVRNLYRTAGKPLGFPLDRPLYQWQVEKLPNIYFQDVYVHHKPTPELSVPFEW